MTGENLRFAPSGTALLESDGPHCLSGVRATFETVSAVAIRVRGEYEEMPGLRLTTTQAARLFGVLPDVAHAVLEDLRRASFLTCSDRGTYALRR